MFYLLFFTLLRIKLSVRFRRSLEARCRSQPSEPSCAQRVGRGHKLGHHVDYNVQSGPIIRS